MTIDQYITSLPAQRMQAYNKLRDICKNTLEPLGFTELMQYKMPSRSVTHDEYPAGYHCDTSLPLPFVSLANQKWSINLYHMWVYAQPDILSRFQSQRPKHCTRKLDMWKSCIRFKKMDDIPYTLIQELLSKTTAQQWISIYEAETRKWK